MEWWTIILIGNALALVGVIHILCSNSRIYLGDIVEGIIGVIEGWIWVISYLAFRLTIYMRKKKWYNKVLYEKNK